MIQPSVQAVVVNYNTRDHLLRCVESLKRTEYDGGVSIIVVDSSSTDGSLAALRHAHPDVEAISVENHGYGAAANQGMAAGRSDYVFVLNADTRVRPDAIGRLVTHLERHPRTAIAGPRLIYPDGSTQPSIRRFPTWLTPAFESTILAEWWPDNPWARRYHMRDVSPSTVQAVDWIVGAAMMVRRIAVDEAGGFDETFRMYAEEVEWCYRLRQHGWEIDWVPDAVVVHAEGASTSQDVPRRQADFDTSRIELQRRLYGQPGAMLANLAIKGGYALIVAREGLKWLLGHRRDLRASRIRFYTQLLRTDLQHNA